MCGAVVVVSYAPRTDELLAPTSDLRSRKTRSQGADDRLATVPVAAQRVLQTRTFTATTKTSSATAKASAPVMKATDRNSLRLKRPGRFQARFRPQTVPTPAPKPIMAALIARRARRRNAESAGTRPAGARRYHCHDHQATNPRPSTLHPYWRRSHPVHLQAGNPDDDRRHLRVVAPGPDVFVRKEVPDHVRDRAQVNERTDPRQAA